MLKYAELAQEVRVATGRLPVPESWLKLQVLVDQRSF